MGWGVVRKRKGKKGVDTSYVGSPALGDREVGMGGRRPLPAVQRSPALSPWEGGRDRGGRVGHPFSRLSRLGVGQGGTMPVLALPAFFPAPPLASPG